MGKEAWPVIIFPLVKSVCFVRYKMMLKKWSDPDSPKAACAAFLQIYTSAQREWKLGKTKVCNRAYGLTFSSLGAHLLPYGTKECLNIASSLSPVKSLQNHGAHLLVPLRGACIFMEASCVVLKRRYKKIAHKMQGKCCLFGG